jgi:hypothetical protein
MTSSPSPSAPPGAPRASSSVHVLPIFRIGTHGSMEGRTLSFGESDLAATVSAYDPALSNAPLVIGHPTRDDAPAFGWVGGLSQDEGVLKASFAEISQEARDLVDGGHYRHVSASFYAPRAKSNPVPGTYYLRHVGLLGAVAPAVKGLGAVSFAAGAPDDEIVTVSFGELDRDAFWSLSGLARGVGRWMRRMRDRTIETDGLEAADRLTPEWDVADVESAATRFAAMAEAEPRDVVGASFSAPPEPKIQTPSGETSIMTLEEIAALQAENAKLKSDNASFSEASAKAMADARRAEDKAFVDGLVVKGVLPPAHVEGVVGFMAKLDDAETVSFSEGAAAATARAYFKGLLDAAKPIVSFGERAGVELGVTTPGNATEMAKAITAKVKDAEARGETLSYADASVMVSGASL